MDPRKREQLTRASAFVYNSDSDKWYGKEPAKKDRKFVHHLTYGTDENGGWDGNIAFIGIVDTMEKEPGNDLNELEETV